MKMLIRFLIALPVALVFPPLACASQPIASPALVDFLPPPGEISPVVILLALASCVVFTLFCLWLVSRSQRRHIVCGEEGLLGERGVAVTAVHRGGKVFVHGEYWEATAGEAIAAGSEIEIVAIVDRLRLRVRPALGEFPAEQE